jgi:hypothetical protein
LSDKNDVGNPFFVARGFIPDGLRSGPKTEDRDNSDTAHLPVLRLLRSRSGINPLATKGY